MVRLRITVRREERVRIRQLQRPQHDTLRVQTRRPHHTASICITTLSRTPSRRAAAPSLRRFRLQPFARALLDAFAAELPARRQNIAPTRRTDR